MPESVAARYRRWGVDELLDKFSGLRIIPSRDEALKIGGELRFRVTGPAGEKIEDGYSIEMRFPSRFPAGSSGDAPSARETGGRIPNDYHKLTDGSLCLAAPTELRLGIGPETKLGNFVERFLIPYLCGFSCFEAGKALPYGELEHGQEGLRQYFASLFGVSDRDAAVEFVRLASLKKRVANKVRCPCGGGQRLGRCHHILVNELRKKLGRGWFVAEFVALNRGNSCSSQDGAAPVLRPSRPQRRPKFGRG